MEEIVKFILSCTSLKVGLRPLNSKIEDEIATILNGKTLNQLKYLKKNIEEKVEKKQDINISYWERLLQHIHMQICRQTILAGHGVYLRNVLRLFQDQKKRVSADIGLSCVLQKSEPEDTNYDAEEKGFLTVNESFSCAMCRRKQSFNRRLSSEIPFSRCFTRRGNCIGR